MNAIEVHNVSKKFISYSSQRDRLFDLATGGRAKRGTDFWALKDINFEVPKGSTFGIIGQNGSGKSTLLSILAGVLRPTSGTFAVSGKIAAILELGSGFHHEFTGRENVYMYGTILGLSRTEIDRRFDEIVDFSDLHEFIDKPLYTYSSGMVMRLAFAVVINVDADVLIVDEALAVGDTLFQYRCFQKIRQLQSKGMTILFVGHDLEAVRNLCSTAILLDQGCTFEKGGSMQVINAYKALISKRDDAYRASLIQNSELTINIYSSNRYGDKRAVIERVDVFDENNCSRQIFESGERAVFRVEGVVIEEIEEGFNVGYTLHNKFSTIYGTNAFLQGINLGKKKKGDRFSVEFVQSLNLGHGIYALTVAVAQSFGVEDFIICDWIDECIHFEVLPNRAFFGSTNLHSCIQIR
ncbi:MAG: ABC transporter ATP-binding protein [bacterium]|nr:ABC transporter ATP-binding protein [bacterium]